MTLSPVFNKDTFSYTSTTSNATVTLNFYTPVGPTYIKSLTVDGVALENRESKTYENGTYSVVCTVAKPGYADVSYTIALTIAANAKDGGDDAEGEPEEEPVVKRSTKSSK